MIPCLSDGSDANGNRDAKQGCDTQLVNVVKNTSGMESLITKEHECCTVDGK